MTLLGYALESVITLNCKCWHYEGWAVAEAVEDPESWFKSSASRAGSTRASARLGGGGGERQPSFLRKDSSWTLDALEDRTGSPSQKVDSSDDMADGEWSGNDGVGTSSPDCTGETTADPSVATPTLVADRGDAFIDGDDDLMARLRMGRFVPG
jgi:hypothetical protein